MGGRKFGFIQLDADPFGQSNSGLRHLQAYRKHHHVKFFHLQTAGSVHIPNAQISCVAYFVQRMDARLDKTDSGIFGPVVIFFVILAEGANIHIKNNTIHILPGMFFGNHGIFNGVHATYGRTIAVAALIGVSGTDALQPGNFFGFFLVGWALQMSHGGSRCAENSFELQAGDDVGAGLVMIDVFQLGRIIGFASGTKNHGTDIDFDDFFLLAVVDGIGQAGLHALLTFTAVAAVQAAGCFHLTGAFFIAQLHLGKIAPAFFHRQLRHASARHARLFFGHRTVARIFRYDRLPSFGHVAAFDVAQDGFSGFLAGTDGTDGHPWAGLQITAGKYPLAFGGKSYRIHFNGAPM